MQRLEAAMRDIIDRLTRSTPGITGSLLGSADGFALASRLHAGSAHDATATAAMAAASLQLTNRMVELVGGAPADVVHQRSADGQVVTVTIDRLALLVVLATNDVDTARLVADTKHAAADILRLLTERVTAGGAGASLPAPPAHARPAAPPAHRQAAAIPTASGRPAPTRLVAPVGGGPGSYIVLPHPEPDVDAERWSDTSGVLARLAAAYPND